MGKSPIVSLGESEPVQDIANMNFSTGTLVLDGADLTFYSWNTKPDYSGDMYKVGDSITLTQNLVTLYGMFLTAEEIAALENGGGEGPSTEPATEPATEPTIEPATEPDAEPSGSNSGGVGLNFWQRILNFFRQIADWFRRLFSKLSGGFGK